MTPLAALRLCVLIGFGYYTAELLGNVLQTLDTFNPSYWGFYVQQQLARPLIGLAVCLVTLLLARPLARWLSRD